MKDDQPNSAHYKLSSLEEAMVQLRRKVCRPQDYGAPLNLTPTQAMMLLEAARLGYPKILEMFPRDADIIRYRMP